ncbi:hypothetical protein CEXT_417601 [Caerostris extrusa]|uniref:Secreted protein n=1 Tax=Caerostris extrusa TaxID=172846 RepID=A0AAV4R8J9_CAEEX|nr:hypothetical protein CEXT_417601 [Caerostris extrusa]
MKQSLRAANFTLPLASAFAASGESLKFSAFQIFQTVGAGLFSPSVRKLTVERQTKPPSKWEDLRFLTCLYLGKYNNFIFGRWILRWVSRCFKVWVLRLEVGTKIPLGYRSDTYDVKTGLHISSGISYIHFHADNTQCKSR